MFLFHISRGKAFDFLQVLGLVVFGLGIRVEGRQVTVKNSCGGTVYAAYAGQGGQVTGVNGAVAPGGWEMAGGASTVLNVPEGWHNARIWARTGCQSGGGGCQVGACKSGSVTCDGAEYGTTGATLAEFTLVPTYETYDVSMVDGYNIPMAITPSGGTSGTCSVASCGTTTDILTDCDPNLVFPKGSSEIWSCQSACGAGIEFASLHTGTFDPANSPTCCNGNWANDCPTSNIPYYAALKENCQMGYVYAKDDANNGALNCNGPSYFVEFCPGGKGAGINPSGISPKTLDSGGTIVGGSSSSGSGSSNSSSGSGSESGASEPAVPVSTSTYAQVGATTPPAVPTTSVPVGGGGGASSSVVAGGGGGGGGGGGRHSHGGYALDVGGDGTTTITQGNTVVVEVTQTEVVTARNERRSRFQRRF
ncbi:hypothetical protein M231_04529 [Tremella mesenterica]|uniref:Thaumatin family protein n=1 Tax=Tremella mesenterica TaxID=5217 RepID=A0A4Q1BKA2_TREME|nr:hypothetical protein M231_04529 [Tremella mesenterica]